MLVYKKSADGFGIFYGDRLIVRHTARKPFLETGTGKGTYKVGGGVYKIRDSFTGNIPACNVRLFSENETRLIFEFGDGPKIIFSDEDGLLSIRFEGLPEKINRMKIRLARSSPEHIFGCGEQYTHLDMSGKKVPLWIEEQGIGRGFDLLTFLANITHNGAGGAWHTTYYSQPTFVSSANYFVHCASSAYAIFDFKKRKTTELSLWQVPEKIYIGVEKDIHSVMSKLTDLVGRQRPLPAWAYDGVWLGVQGGNEAVRRKYEDAKKAGLPVAALWAQDWEGRRTTSFGRQLWWNWRYDEELYPGLPVEIASYLGEGVRYLGYINPFLAVEKELYEEASKRGFLLAGLEEKEILVKVTTFPAAIVDLTNPEAFAWIKGVIKNNMIGIGLSGWMADFGEWMPVDSKPFSGENPELLHNKYAVLWAKANFEAIEEAGKSEEIVFFSRSGYTGSSRYSPVFWAGDQMANFSSTDGLATVIVSGLSLGFNGIGISHSDIGGYTSVGYIKRTKEVFMRWVEQAAFTPIMRTHESNRPDTNWQFNSDSETLFHFTKMAKVHVALKPYIASLVGEYSRTGMPPIRHMYFHYPDDRIAVTLKHQYLFGEYLLVAPVVKAGKKFWRVYIPDENWIGLWDGLPVCSGWNKVASPLGKPPVFYCKGSPWNGLFQQIQQVQVQKEK